MPPMSEQHGSPDERTARMRRHRGHMVLEAGAGTGKTYSLTERVIYQLVERRVPLERILALTFTDFAAAEMRARIYKAINGRLSEAGGDNEDETAHLQDTRRRFSRNYISTFHAFCNRILQYFPDELTEIAVWDQPVFEDADGEVQDEDLQDTGVSAAKPSDADVSAADVSNTERSATGGTAPYGIPNSRNVEGSFELLGDYDEILRMLEWRKSFYKKYKKHAGLQRQLSRLRVSDFESFMMELGRLEDGDLHRMAVLSPQDYINLIRRLAEVWKNEKMQLETSLLEDFSAHPEWFANPDKRPESYAEMERLKTKTTGGFQQRIFKKKEMEPETIADVNDRAVRLFKYAAELEKAEALLSKPELVEHLNNYPDQDEFDADLEAYWNMRDLSELALRWHFLMRYQRFEEGYFNYNDMIWLTHTLFDRNPVVVRQMQDRFDQILVDEFQDTDHRQWQIIRKLGFAGAADESRDKEILIVGDVKQAIYGFRGGDVAMMQQARNELTERPGSVRVIPLDYSFRSNRTITGFANRLFRKIFADKSGAASYEAPHQPLSVPSPDLSLQAEAQGEIRVLQTGYDDLKKHEDDWSIAAEALAGHMALLESRRIARFLREVYDGHWDACQRIAEKMRMGETAVGILYRRRTHIYAMEQALSEAGLPFTVAKGTRFYERREIRDAWLLLSFLLDAYDDVSLTGLLRSPMISLSDSGLLAIRVAMDNPGNDYPNFWSAVTDHRSWSGDLLKSEDRFVLAQGVSFLQQLREKVPVRRVSDLLEQAFFTDGPWFGAHTGDSQAAENLVKLLDVIRNLESSGRGTLFEITGFLSDRIREQARDSEAEQPDPAPIQLMTIHGAKGLQFPMVVIPDMYAGPNEGGVQLNVAASDQDSIAWPAIACKPGTRESDDDTDDSFLNEVLKTESRKRNLAELKRLFYVAVTRAETHLLLSMARPHRASDNGTFAGMFAKWLGDQDPASETDDFVVEELTLEELEALAGSAAYPKHGKMPEGTGEEHGKRADGLGEGDEPASTRSAGADAGYDTDSGFDRMPEPMTGGTFASRPTVKPAVIDRSSDTLAAAHREVSAGTLTASGDSAGTDMAPEPHAATPAPWKMMTSADAGTLIHRTLETGLVDTEVVETFWKRELLKMGYAKPDDILAENRNELRRHFRNALTWIDEKFGEEASRRFEVAFELKTRSVKEETVTYRGSMDMIIRDRNGTDHIVDFKTGPVPDRSALRKYAEQYGYHRQIDVYRQAYQEISQQDMPAERVWLLFTDPEKGQGVTLADFSDGQ